MLIIPAIDIRNGKCVRLTQGNFEREKVYSGNPEVVAKIWAKQGAKMLHIVDLDGAKNGNLVNLEIIKNITQNVKIPIQGGGRIRNQEAVKALFAIGVSRGILGTVSLEDEGGLKNFLNDYASRVAVELARKNRKLSKRGCL